jgi:3-methyl-2-oxobutanoate hydroxymethyltransferase
MEFMAKKITVPEIRELKTNGRKVAFVTCYDYTSATIVEKSDIEMILVGDSLGMTMLGYDGTVGVTVDDIIHHGKAVRRGAPTTFIIGDMPFGSYNESAQQAIHNATRFMTEIGADAIKLEGGVRSAAVVKAIVEAGIPVCGHIGLTPQISSNMGGFKVQGKSMDAANALLEDAKAIEGAGAFMIMIEGVPATVSKYIRDNISIPVVGIGAGPGCEIQALIMHDMLGCYDWVPKFAKKYANIGPEMLNAFNEYHKEVVEEKFPTAEYSYNTKVEGLE